MDEFTVYPSSLTYLECQALAKRDLHVPLISSVKVLSLIFEENCKISNDINWDNYIANNVEEIHVVGGQEFLKRDLKKYATLKQKKIKFIFKKLSPKELERTKELDHLQNRLKSLECCLLKTKM